MKKVAVVGVGSTRFSGPQEKTAVELFAEAATDAITESDLKPGDIEALFMGNALGDFEEGQGMLQAYAAASIGCRHVPANKYEGACASASMALRDAFIWVASGYYDIVLAGGVERAASMGTGLATRTFAMFSDARYEYPSGITFPAVFAMLAHLYADTYKIPLPRLREQMARVSIQSYNHGSVNPKAQFFGKNASMPMEKVLGSFVVSTPLTLHDCCPFSDGAAAVVMASEAVAKRLTKKPVYITGIGQASGGLLASQGDYLPRFRTREISSQQAYKMAGLKPPDIDLCELHDCFSIASLIAAEGLGFFEYGKGGEAWEKGEADIGGKIAINPSGGLKAKGHPIGATGAGQVYEIVRQLRGEVEPERQVPGARIGMTDTLGGDGGTLVNMILQRGW
jgi:acetyl-CoA C-acetyltransferase/acetyl-CoA acyltransferase